MTYSSSALQPTRRIRLQGHPCVATQSGLTPSEPKISPGDIIADDKSQTGGQDCRLNVHEDYELRDWAEKFDVTRERLKDAVAAVGTDAAAVEKWAGGSP